MARILKKFHYGNKSLPCTPLENAVLLGFFPEALTKYPDKSNLGRNGFLGSQIEAIVYYCGETEAAGT